MGDSGLSPRECVLGAYLGASRSFVEYLAVGDALGTWARVELVLVGTGLGVCKNGEFKWKSPGRRWRCVD